MRLLQIYIDELIYTALKEDINYIDVATDYLIDDESVSTGTFIAKAQGVLCGIEVAARVFELIYPKMEITLLKRDGDTIEKGDKLATIHGSTAMLLKGERVSLNMLSHMSGIASAVNECVCLIEGTNASIAETRKTLPGLRALQKYSVVVGGGRNHRFNLSDAAMLKDNHIDSFGSITAAVNKLREKIGHTCAVEVEVRSLEELREALDVKCDLIMLDNMSLEDMRKAVEITAGKAKLEASGNVTKDNIREIALTGVDIISMGALTHSVKALDISFNIA